MTLSERQLEDLLIVKLTKLKHTWREDIRDHAKLVAMAPSSPLIY